MSVSRVVEEAVEVIDAGEGAPSIVLSVEHASNRMPEPWKWPDEDAWVTETHWAWDPGAAEIAKGLALRLRGRAVLSRFSRLLCDPNRGIGEENLFRVRADGRRVRLNERLGDEDRAIRLERYWEPYHRAFDHALGTAPGAMALSIHSFTPVYEGVPRDVEVGVLYCEREDIAIRLADAIRAHSGRDVRLNEPYSGMNGLMFSVYRHASTHRRLGMELEFRQDLAGDPAVREELIRATARALEETGLLRARRAS